MRVLIEIRKPIISLLSETISNHSQDLITLSTDFVLVYQREKVQNVKEELKKGYNLLKKEIAKNEITSKEKKFIENKIYDDKMNTISINVWLYDICPFICSLEEFHEKDITIPKRKIMNLFDFNYESKTIMQYLDPNNYIITYDSFIDIKKIVVKLSYRDLVLFLKVVEYNNSLFNEEYEKRIESLENVRYKMSILKQNSMIISQNPQNDSRYSILAQRKSIKDEVHFKNLISTNESLKINNNVAPENEKNENDKIIDNGMTMMKVNFEEIQIVINHLFYLLKSIFNSYNYINLNNQSFLIIIKF